MVLGEKKVRNKAPSPNIIDFFHQKQILGRRFGGEHREEAKNQKQEVPLWVSAKW